MRAIVLLALAASPAFGKPLAQESADWVSGHLAWVLADKVEVGTVWFADPACATAFGKPVVVDDSVGRDQLSRCLWGDGGAGQQAYRLGDRLVVVQAGEPQALELALHHGRIVRIGPAAATRADRATITLDRGVDAAFAPSPRVRTAIERSDAGTAEAIFKLCHDANNKITSRRAVTRSGNDAFDDEAEAYARKLAATPFAPGGTALAACDLVYLRYPNFNFDTGLDANPDAVTRDTVSTTELMERHIAGEKRIVPDDVTKVEIMRSGKVKIVATFGLCIDANGDPSSLQITKSSGFPAFDAKLQHGILDWRFQPFAAGVCAPITFIYVQY